MNIGLYYRGPPFVECIEAWVFETCTRDDLLATAVAVDDFPAKILNSVFVLPD